MLNFPYRLLTGSLALPSPVITAGIAAVMTTGIAISFSQTALAHDEFRLGKTDINEADIRYHNPASDTALNVEQTRELVKKLAQTKASNQTEINTQLQLQRGEHHGKGFNANNPYYPRLQPSELDFPLPKPRTVLRDGKTLINPEGYDDPFEGFTKNANGDVQFYQQKPVTQWLSDISHRTARAQQVCAVKFTDTQQTEYQLKTFNTQAEAELRGWTVTHQYQCGTCSTLQDLAVYIGVPNQTVPISICTSQGRGDYNNLAAVKQCIIDAVGFTEMCAETWAYNGIHTGVECRDSGQFTPGDPLVLNKKTGKLHSRLWCDEKISGPGFKYSAGRTRRGSGLESAIARPNDVLFYDADHSRYFQ